MSLQLVYSVKDIAHIQPPSLPKTSVDSDDVQNEEKADWLKTLRYSLSSLAYFKSNAETMNARSSPSSPSGYETASDHSSEIDVQSPKRNSFNYAKEDLEEMASFPNVCSPLLEKLRTPYGPRKGRILENLLGNNMLDITVENYLAPTALTKTVSNLRKELYQLKLNINRDIVEFCKTFFHLEDTACGKRAYPLCILSIFVWNSSEETIITSDCFDCICIENVKLVGSTKRPFIIYRLVGNEEKLVG